MVCVFPDLSIFLVLWEVLDPVLRNSEFPGRLRQGVF